MLVSYAQNFEDVILWRALGTIERGFYIDLGAQDPVIDSVSLAFYEKGWRGVHVEPIPAYAQKLRAARPDEEIIEAAIASTRGRLTIREFADTGLSTGRNEIAERHEAKGFTSKPIEVEALRLSDVFDKYPGKEIHWLKIDVEGMETDVIASWKPSPARPWVLVVEGTMPLSQEPGYFKWEPTILAMDYEFVYFDGLNRFYVHQAHAGLRDSFGAGPNVFDDFALSGKSNAPFTSHLQKQVAGLDDQLRTHEENRLGEIDRLHCEITKKDAEAERLRLSAEEKEEAHLNERADLARRVDLLEKEGRNKDGETDRIRQDAAEFKKKYETDRAALTERNAIFEKVNRERAEEVGWLHRHVAEMDKAFAAERTALTERATILERLKQEKDDEVGQLLRHGEETQKAYAVTEAALTERATSLQELISEKDRQIAQLNDHIMSARQSHVADRATMKERAELLEKAIRKRDADITRLRRRLTIVEKAYEGEGASLRARTAQADQHEAIVGRLMSAHEAEVAQMEHSRETAAEKNARIVSGLEAALAEREASLAEKTAALDRAENQLTVSDRRITTILSSKEALKETIGELDAQLAGKTVALQSATERAAQIDRRLAAVHASASWRLTRPLRACYRGILAVIRWPRSAAASSLHHGISWLRHRPRALALVRRTVALLPPLERRVLTFARARSDSLPQVEAGWALEPDTEALEAWHELLRVPSGKG